MGGFFIGAAAKAAFFMPEKGRKVVSMSDEKQAQEQVEQPIEETDWQAKYEAMREHSRDWEKKAKANQSAAEELEKLKAEQMTEQELLEKRAAEAESELAQLRAEKAKVDAATKLASETGVPFDMLMFCSDEESMTDFAKAYARETHVSSAPSALSGSRIVRDGGGKVDNADLFAEFAKGMFD